MDDYTRLLMRLRSRTAWGSQLALEAASAIDGLVAENARLLAERDAALEKLAEVREIYAGAEGFLPETAPEAYCLDLIREMAHAAMKESGNE